ncbi:MAG TPA: DUF3311 domain-containing protein [Rhizobiaceae bacterium]|nr:DUF3311 domain-containing protein [Rhizobiaceae bacterium]
MISVVGKTAMAKGSFNNKQQSQRGNSMPRIATLLIGLGIPILLTVIIPPFLNNAELTWSGIPLLLLWMFFCIPATAFCLIICWYCFDRPAYLRHDGGSK